MTLFPRPVVGQAQSSGDARREHADALKEAIKQRGGELAEKLLGEREKKASGDNWLLCSPFREDRHPSFIVAQSNGHFCDLANGESGDVFDLLARLQGLDAKSGFPEVICRAATLLGLPVDAPAAVATAGPSADPTRESLAAEYGLAWSDFEKAGWTWRDAAKGPEIAYPLAGPDVPADATKFKSARRNADRKRACRLELRGAKVAATLIAPRGSLESIDRDFNERLVWAEGEEKALAAHVAGLPAASPANGASSVPAPELIAWLREQGARELIVAFDADDAGRNGATKTAAAFVAGGVESVRVVEWPPDAPKGRDLNDVLKEGGVPALRAFIDAAIPYAPPAPATAPGAGDAITAMDETEAGAMAAQQPPAGRIVSLGEILATEYREPLWIVPGMIPEGLTLLVAAPKIGKSFMLQGLALSVAFGGPAFGNAEFRTTAGDSLLIMLEDPKRRVKKNMLKLLEGAQLPRGDEIMVATEWTPANTGGLQELDSYLAGHPSIRLVGIDTLARFRSDAGGRSARGQDEDALWVGKLQKIAVERRVAIVALTHDRKAKAERDDKFTKVAGTRGIIGSADTIIYLERTGRKQTALASVTGREVEDRAWLLRFEGGRWVLLGDADSQAATPEREAVFELLAEEPGLTPRVAAERMSKGEDATKKLLSRMARDGLLVKEGRGRYFLASSPSPSLSPSKEEDEKEEIVSPLSPESPVSPASPKSLATVQHEGAQQWGAGTGGDVADVTPDSLFQPDTPDRRDTGDRHTREATMGGPLRKRPALFVDPNGSASGWVEVFPTPEARDQVARRNLAYNSHARGCTRGCCPASPPGASCEEGKELHRAIRADS